MRWKTDEVLKAAQYRWREAAHCGALPVGDEQVLVTARDFAFLAALFDRTYRLSDALGSRNDE